MRFYIIYIPLLCLAVTLASSQDINENSAPFPFLTPDGTSAEDFEIFDDFPVAQLETDDISSNLDFDWDVGEAVFLPQTYALDDCSAFNNQQLGKRIRVREESSICSSEPKTSADKKTNSDGDGDGDGDFIFKNNDGIETEPKNAMGLNRYGTNSDGTICPPDMWLLCSSAQGDYFESFCHGCYPCQFSGFDVRASNYHRRVWGLTAHLHRSLLVFFGHGTL